MPSEEGLKQLQSGNFFGGYSDKEKDEYTKNMKRGIVERMLGFGKADTKPSPSPSASPDSQQNGKQK